VRATEFPGVEYVFYFVEVQVLASNRLGHVNISAKGIPGAMFCHLEK
jgi:hypothetical protein